MHREKKDNSLIARVTSEGLYSYSEFLFLPVTTPPSYMGCGGGLYTGLGDGMMKFNEQHR